MDRDFAVAAILVRLEQEYAQSSIAFDHVDVDCRLRGILARCADEDISALRFFWDLDDSPLNDLRRLQAKRDRTVMLTGGRRGKRSRATGPGIYMQVLSLTHALFLGFIASLELLITNNQFKNVTFDTWKAAALAAAPDTVFYIKYIGQTTSGDYSLRWLGGNQHLNKSALKGYLVSYANQKNLRWDFFRLPSAPLKSPQDIDATERLWIMLSNHPFTLNQQPGGRYLDYHPPAHLSELTGSTTFGGKKIDRTLEEKAQKKEEMTTWFASTCGEIFGADRRKRLFDIFACQALQSKEILFVGLDNTAEELASEDTYFGGISRAATLHRLLLGHLSVSQNDINMAFINVLPCGGDTRYSKIFEQQRIVSQILDVLDPAVVLGLGERVAWLFGTELKRTSSMQEPLRKTLCKPYVFSRSEHKRAIFMPLYDYGVAKHQSTPQHVLDVLFLQTALAQILQDHVQEKLSAGTGKTKAELQACLDTLQTLPTWTAIFDKLKTVQDSDAIFYDNGKIARTRTADMARAREGKRALFERGGVLEGPADSDERRAFLLEYHRTRSSAYTGSRLTENDFVARFTDAPEGLSIASMIYYLILQFKEQKTR